MSIEERMQEEKAQILSVLSFFNVPESKLKLLAPVVENTAWMSVKLEEARETIKNSSIAITYDNGGGQKGIRENPLFKGYNALWKSYMSGINQLLTLIPDTPPDAKPEEVEKQQSMLDIIRSKHNK